MTSSLDLDTLLDMARHFKAYPPREGDREGELKEVFLHPGQRLQLRMVRTQDIGYGLWREDKLAEHGVFGAESDSLQFAERLYAAIEGELSIRNLEHLVQVFSKALKTERDRREAWLAREDVSSARKSENTGTLETPAS